MNPGHVLVTGTDRAAKPDAKERQQFGNRPAFTRNDDACAQ
jgi:hypothetical protein